MPPPPIFLLLASPLPITVNIIEWLFEHVWYIMPTVFRADLYLVLYISQLSNQIAERVDNIFRIIHVFVDNIVSIDTRPRFCLKSYVAVELNSRSIGGRRKLMKGVASESSIRYGSRPGKQARPCVESKRPVWPVNCALNCGHHEP